MKFILLIITFCSSLSLANNPIFFALNTRTTGLRVVTSAKGAGSGATTVATTNSVNTTGATLIVIAIVEFSTTIGTPTDSKGNTWTPLNQYGSAPSTYDVKLYYASNPIVGSGHTFSTETSNYPALTVIAFSGGSTYDSKNSGSDPGLSATLQPGALTASVAHAMYVTAVTFNLGQTPTINSGFTIAQTQANASGNIGISIAYLDKTLVTSTNPTWNLGSADTSTATMAVWRP